MQILGPGQVGPLLARLASEALATFFVSFFLPFMQTQVSSSESFAVPLDLGTECPHPLSFNFLLYLQGFPTLT